MKKHNSKKTKKIRNLIVVCALTAIVLSVSTYAWFIGMKTVNVSSFEIEIATTEGLWLSMDGQNWAYTLDVRHAPAYDNNTNNWAESGLIPVSTVGDMDNIVSRMKLYEKGSLTTTRGGYRLLTSRVNNNTVTGNVVSEGKGYVVFDLFIKNLSGTAYYPINEPKNEEAIYLTINSEVKVGSGGVSNTGIENSVRIAFAQIGRVDADTTSISSITGITCTDVAENETTKQAAVTGICRNATIWEPNDTDHVDNAINWYKKSCSTRDGSDVNDEESYNYGTECSAISHGTAYPTYAISRPIVIADNVDIYDGLKYNTYQANTIDYLTYNTATGTTKESYKLVDFPYFTDTMKDKTGTLRPTFMTLAPNSITKVRVYVYIEGQDVDNYDFASLGQQIEINFGFTKERFIENDITYSGPSTNITDPTATHEQITSEQSN